MATLQEGISLRRAGIDAPVLLLGNLIEAEDLRCCLHWRLMPTLSSLDEAKTAVQRSADGEEPPLPGAAEAGHGHDPSWLRLAGGRWAGAAIQGLPQLELVGLYSHLACADEPTMQLTQVQLQRFQIRSRGSAGWRSRPVLPPGQFRWHHEDPALHHDMVRVGLALYGHAPAEHLGLACYCSLPWRVKARVSLIRQVPSGSGGSATAIVSSPSRPCRRAVVIGIGYADGVVRSLSGRIHAAPQRAHAAPGGQHHHGPD